MDWTDETLTFCLRLRFFGTRIGWMGHGSFAFGGGFFGTRIEQMGHGFFLRNTPTNAESTLT